ncbi:hypothetical protein XELAEV_18033254mg [Xenopus laevis]|uniref:Uncharacterized protein n=1 Tax=Xenopus laevis TaxID=8355 RepID=A0A974CK09_XENLA|nr:hypothetical protein XELAEV_18033254mg [Xenopus laevis]
MGDFAEAHNDLADSHTKTQAELERLTDKVTDLEDLENHVSDLLKAILPELQTLEMAMDRKYRVLKHRAAPDSAPRDITKFLRQNNIPFRWEYRAKLIVQRNRVPTIMSTVSEAKKAQPRWDIPTVAEDSTRPWQQTPPHSSRKLQKEWQKPSVKPTTR